MNLQDKTIEKLLKTENLKYTLQGRYMVHTKAEFEALSHTDKQMELAEMLKDGIEKQGLTFESCKVASSGDWGLMRISVKLTFKNEFNIATVVISSAYRINNSSVSISEENPANYNYTGISINDKNNKEIYSYECDLNQNITEQDILPIIMELKAYMSDKENSDKIDKEKSDKKFSDICYYLSKYAHVDMESLKNEPFRKDLNNLLNKYINK